MSNAYNTEPPPGFEARRLPEGDVYWVPAATPPPITPVDDARARVTRALAPPSSLLAPPAPGAPPPPSFEDAVAARLPPSAQQRFGFTPVTGGAAGGAPGGPEMRAYEPSTRERIAAFLTGDAPSPGRRSLVRGTMGSTGLPGPGFGLVDLVPGGQFLGAQEALREGNVQGAAINVLPGARAATAPLRGARRAAPTVARELETPPAGIGHNMPPEPPATGSMNPLHNVPVTFRGKEPKDFTPDDWHAFGLHHGVENIGPLSPVETFKDRLGNEIQVPGGLEGKWTYYDLLHMKANPINPANLDRALHTQLQRKLGRTMSPEELTDAQVWNGLVFGMTSPNNPLFPNQVTASRLRLRTPEMLDDLASMIPERWSQPGYEVTKQERKLINDQVAARYGLNKAAAGGLGTRGTADYSRVAEMAKLFRENPEFFRKAPDESWDQAVERISSQLPGLSMKTGSFGTVWQNPAEAAISAIDRHMARELNQRGGIFASRGEERDWQQRSVNLWNKREEKRVADAAKKGKIEDPDLATNFRDMVSKKGADGFIGEMMLDHVGKELTPRFRLAKTGEINPKIPEHLQTADWVREPETVFKMGRAYKRALEVNQKIADEHGLNLFMSQWLEWDRIRNRFEPHENMFPGLEKMPAMSVEQLRAIDAAHRATGHKTYGKNPEGKLKPTRPLAAGPSPMGYLGLGGAMVAPTALGEMFAPKDARE